MEKWKKNRIERIVARNKLLDASRHFVDDNNVLAYRFYRELDILRSSPS